MEHLRLQEAVIFLVAAGLVIPLVRRLHISPMLGFLLVGIAVGPHSLAQLADQYTWLQHVLITDVEGITALAELGVVFLLFMIGLELSFERLWGMRRLVLGMGNAQILLSGLVIGLIAYQFDNSLQVSVVLGSCLALSSTAMVVQIITEQGRFGTAIGQGSFAILLAQDIAVVPILFLVGTFGAQTGGSFLGDLGLAFGTALIAIVAILGIGRLIVRPLFRLVSGTHSPELFMAATLLIIIATAAITHSAGMSAALGAFLAGLLFSETEYCHEIEVNIEPFKGLLLGLFFMSVGMGINLMEIASNPVWLALSIVGLFLIKAVITTIIARFYGFTTGQSLEMGLLLGQGGEFAFVVIGLAIALSLLPLDTAQFMLIVVSATMLLTPLVARLAQRIGIHFEQRTPETSEEINLPPELSKHVVIIGYGRTGKLLTALLDRQKIPHVALEKDANRVAHMRAKGAPVYVGDATRQAILEKVHIHQAAALVISTDNDVAAERVLQTARKMAPDLPIIVRAHDDEHAARLLDMGATQIVPEVLEAGLHMGQLLLENVGFPSLAAHELVDNHRQDLLSTMYDSKKTPKTAANP